MLDIIEVKDGQDLMLSDTVIPRAANVLAVQLGSLEYAPNFGADLAFFFYSNIRFQNASIKAYLIERLTQAQISIAEVLETVETFIQRLTFKFDREDQSSMLAIESQKAQFISEDGEVFITEDGEYFIEE